VTDDERERAWATVHDAMAQIPGWAVGPCTYHGEVALWHVAAIDLRPRGRYAKREAITATGATEIAALRALVALVEARQSDGTRSGSAVARVPPLSPTAGVDPARLWADGKDGQS
jgi:hypothetical protein